MTHAEAETGSSDGRRRRSERSRDRVVTAMIELVNEGVLVPSAEQVATRAKIGLRTVFRQFNDMENLRSAVQARFSAEIEKWRKPFAGATWRDQLDELIARRTEVYERLFNLRRASDIHLHESPSIQAERSRLLKGMRLRLESILPDALKRERPFVETLDLLVSFEVWARLRVEQGLSAKRSKAIIRAQVELLLAASGEPVRPAPPPRPRAR